MKCKHCDCTVVEGDIICPNCGMYLEKQQEPPVPRIAVEDRVLEEVRVLPVEDEQEPAEVITNTETVSDDDSYDEELPESIPQQPAPTDKKNKTPILLIVVAALAMAVAIALLLCFGSVRGWLARTFYSPKELLIKVCQNGGENAVSLVYTAANSSQNTETQKNNTQLISIKPGKYLLDLLSVSMYGQSKDISWLDEVRIMISSSDLEGYSQSQIQLGLGETTVISAASFTNAATGELWLSFPELSDQALLFTPEEYALPSSHSAPSYEELLAILPDEGIAQLLRQKYLDIFLSGFSVVKKSTEKITVDQVTQKVWTLEASSTEREYISMTISFLEALKQDPQIEMIISQYSAVYGSNIYNNSYTGEPVDLYQVFLEKVNKELDTCYARISSCDPANVFTFRIYINNRNQIIGFDSVTATEEDFRIIILMDGMKYALECVIGDNCLTGSGSLGLEVSGDLLLCVKDEPYLAVRVQGLTRKNGDYCGQIVLEPTAEMLRGLLYDMTDNMTTASMLSMTDITVHITLTEQLQSIAMVSNGTDLITVEYAQCYTDMEAFQIPGAAINCLDTDALIKWFSTLKWHILLGKLSEAGVPMDAFVGLLGSALVDNGM